MNADQIKNQQKDFTSAEIFLSRLSDASDAHKMRDDEVAQHVCDLFIRQNSPRIHKIDVSTHLMPVYQSPSERASYLDNVSRFSGAKFNIKEIQKADKNDSDREVQVKNRLKDCSDCEQALIQKAGFDNSQEQFPQTLDGTLSRAISEARAEEYSQAFELLKHLLRKVDWLRHHEETRSLDKYEQWGSRIKAHTLGDEEVTSDVLSAITIVEQTLCNDDWKKFWFMNEDEQLQATPGPFALSLYPQGKCPRKQYQKLDNKVVELRTTLTEATKLTQQMVTGKRAARFFARLAEMTEGDLDSRFNCEGADCQSRHLAHDQFTIFVPCGHILCNEKCADANDESCPVRNCDAAVVRYEKTNMAYLGCATNPNTDLIMPHYFGQKIEVLTDLINSLQDHQRITSSTGGILLFVQFSSLQKWVLNALKQKKVGVTLLGDGGNASKTLENWQKAHDKNPVLLLSMGDVNAAGSNLTRANHVIFFSPYHVKGDDSQAVYQDQRIQAIGRAARLGQDYSVHVYDLLSTNTIDVDIIQMRNKKMLKRVEHHNEALPYPAFEPAGLALVEAEEGERGEFTSVASELLFPDLGA
ncbi:DNA repair protein RAD8 [Phlyctema vagabunda]|uniref:DNA repair protein RAD8 n=1 Tax=Phlyctema vagabunda TaxID=108571 RepID=A0ABR4PL36_9HELO